MKKCLTVDLDIIMGPSIASYDTAETPCGSGKPIFDYELEHPEIRNSMADLKVYEAITNYILFICEQGKANTIKFVDCHKDILNYIEPDDNWECDNIDFHMDLISGDFGNEIPPIVNDGNWAYFLFRDYGLKKYTNVNYSDTEMSQIDTEVDYVKDYDINIVGFDNYNFDYDNLPDVTVLCASYEWVTTQFWPLFQLWKDIVNSFLEIDKK